MGLRVLESKFLENRDCVGVWVIELRVCGVKDCKVFSRVGFRPLRYLI